MKNMRLNYGNPKLVAGHSGILTNDNNYFVYIKKNSFSVFSLY